MKASVKMKTCRRDAMKGPAQNNRHGDTVRARHRGGMDEKNCFRTSPE